LAATVGAEDPQLNFDFKARFAALTHSVHPVFLNSAGSIGGLGDQNPVPPGLKHVNAGTGRCTIRGSRRSCRVGLLALPFPVARSACAREEHCKGLQWSRLPRAMTARNWPDYSDFEGDAAALRLLLTERAIYPDRVRPGLCSTESSGASRADDRCAGRNPAMR
jgi:hypothetical protein